MKEIETNTAERVNRGILSLGVLIISVLFSRFFLSIFEVDPRSGLAEFVCAVSDPVLVPVLVVLGQEPPYAASMLEFSSLVGVVFYLVITHSLLRLTTLFPSEDGLTTVA